MTIVALADELHIKADTIIKAVKRGDDTFTKVLGSDGITKIALLERRSA
jgi:hypothetical protein